MVNEVNLICVEPDRVVPEGGCPNAFRSPWPADASRCRRARHSCWFSRHRRGEHNFGSGDHAGSGFHSDRSLDEPWCGLDHQRRRDQQREVLDAQPDQRGERGRPHSGLAHPSQWFGQGHEVLRRGDSARLPRRHVHRDRERRRRSRSTRRPVSRSGRTSRTSTRRSTPPAAAGTTAASRSAAGLVYNAQLDGTLVALNQQTGAVIWKVPVFNWREGVTLTSAPLYYNGVVYVGSTGGEFGFRGSVTAYNATNGNFLWRFFTVPPPGDIGGQTWAAGPLGFSTGGATVWNTPSVDPRRTRSCSRPATQHRGRAAARDRTSSPRRSSRSTQRPGRSTGGTRSFTTTSGTTTARPRRSVRRHDRRHQPQRDRRGLQDRLALRARPDERDPAARDPGDQGAADEGPEHLADSADSGRRRLHTQCAKKSTYTGKPGDRGPPGDGGLHVPPTTDARGGDGPERTGRRRLEPVGVQPGDAPLYVCAADSDFASWRPRRTLNANLHRGGRVLGVNFGGIKFYPGHVTAMDVTTNKVAWGVKWPSTCYSGSSPRRAGSCSPAGQR